MSNAHALPLPPRRRTTPRLDNPHERRFRELEVAMMNLIFDLGITDLQLKKKAMAAGTNAIVGIRETLAALAPGKLST